ncbi:hypothetical protein [uncultured Algibacter sp.]|uniref:hypothetical protein n=1 Tax=uncultured Algibacter sp. TaxID=298659 RepID=UPI003217F0EB
MASQNLNTRPEDSQMLISYNLLRRIIGCIAFLLPIVLAIGGILYGGCTSIENSISDYYHTEMRNILVGTLCAVAMFMFAYRGPNKSHKISGNVACFSALCVAFFPTGIDTVSQCATNCMVYKSYIKTIHLISALSFFGILIYFSLKLFPSSKDATEMVCEQAKKRDTIYYISGYVMLSCIILIALYLLFEEQLIVFRNFKPVFVLEFVALWAFGLAWMAKGQLFLKNTDNN